MSQPPLLSFTTLSQLLLALAPASTPSDLAYFFALFDLDGDGYVNAEDVMDAFEEAGTTLHALQTPAHKVSISIVHDWANVYL